MCVKWLETAPEHACVRVNSQQKREYYARLKEPCETVRRRYHAVATGLVDSFADRAGCFGGELETAPPLRHPPLRFFMVSCLAYGPHQQIITSLPPITQSATLYMTPWTWHRLAWPSSLTSIMSCLLSGTKRRFVLWAMQSRVASFQSHQSYHLFL